MGKTQSRMEEARKELAELESKGDSAKLREKLHEYIGACRLEGELGEAVTYLSKLLELQEKGKESALDRAATMYILGNTLRLQLQPMIESNKPSPFLDEKERTKAYARAEDLLLRALEIRSEALKVSPDSRDLKLAIARTKSALAMIQNSYGGNSEAAQAQHVGALEIFAEFPLASDPEGWSFVRGVWSSTKLGVVAPSNSQPPAPTFPSRPGLATEDSRSFRVDSRISDQPGLRTQRATTTNTHNIGGEGEEGSVTEDEGANPQQPNANRSTKWRLIIRIPRQQTERRPSVFRRIASFNNNTSAGSDAFEGIVQKIDLEPGKKVEVGLPISETKKALLKSQGTTYIALGPKDRLGKVICERHCVFEEDAAADESNRRWTVSDSHATGKYKGILVNGVRANRAPLRPGDTIQLGACAKVKLGSSASADKSKTVLKDLLQGGLEYSVERVITTIDDTDVSSVAPSFLFEASDTADTAFKHFHLLAVAAQMNLNGPPFGIEYTSDLFAAAVKSRVPFHLWDSWIYSELSRARLAS